MPVIKINATNSLGAKAQKLKTQANNDTISLTPATKSGFCNLNDFCFDISYPSSSIYIFIAVILFLFLFIYYHRYSR